MGKRKHYLRNHKDQLKHIIQSIGIEAHAAGNKDAVTRAGFVILQIEELFTQVDLLLEEAGHGKLAD